MSASDLALYARYTARRGFPGRRVEKLLAQVAKAVFQSVGVKDLTLSDFLMDPPPLPEGSEPVADAPQGAPATEEDERAAEQAFGFSPRNRRRPDPEPLTESKPNDGQ